MASFKQVFILLPQGPKDYKRFEEFEDYTRSYSYEKPFNLPKSPIPSIKLEVSMIILGKDIFRE